MNMDNEKRKHGAERTPPETRIIIVTGGRDWADRHKVFYALMSNLVPGGSNLIFHGDCPSGADRLASEWCVWAKQQGFKLVELKYPADWQNLGKKAGPARNRAMVAAALIAAQDKSDVVCLAFWDGLSRGTGNCIETAVRAGVRVEITPA